MSFFAGAGVASITAPADAEPLGGYWGRKANGKAPRAGDGLDARVVTLRSTGGGGAAATTALCIVSLDLVGVHAATADALKAAVLGLAEARACGLRTPADILLSCTHTHTAPQSHTNFIGMGHASVEYMGFLRDAVLRAVRASIAAMVPASVARSRTRPVEGVSINRRQRVLLPTDGDADDGKAGAGASSAGGAAPRRAVRWFEEAGRTALGQRPAGPRVPCADVIEFRPGIATVVAFACHPTHLGPALEQSGDYCGAVRRGVEAAAAAAAAAHSGPDGPDGAGVVLYLNGACGDVNPVRHRGGFEAAEASGVAIAAAVAAVMGGGRGGGGGEGGPVAASGGAVGAPVYLRNDLQVLKLPRQPLPAPPDAQSFVDQQAAWLADEQRREQQVETGDGEAAAGALGSACAAACHEYARGVLDLSRQAHGADAAAVAETTSAVETVEFRIQVCRVGPVRLVALEGEIFAGYALSLARTGTVIAGGDPAAAPIVVGYANGCVGYVPTEDEFPWGGYEVCHAFRVYGQPTMLAPTAERHILHAANRMLRDAAAAPTPTCVPAPLPVPSSPDHQRLPPGSGLLAIAADSRFPTAHDTYNSIGADAAGAYVYYVLSSAEVDTGARLYRVPVNAAGRHLAPEDLGDLTTEACRDPPDCVVQGKSHVPLVDAGAALGIVFATHVGFYSFRDGMETLSVQGDPELEQAGRKPYPGGVVLSFLPPERRAAPTAAAAPRRPWIRHGRVPGGEGVLTMAVDAARRRAFFLTWPTGQFGVCALRDGNSSDDGGGGDDCPVIHGLRGYPGMHKGELVHPRTGEYRCVCRSMVVDPRTGRVYWTTGAGDVLEYDHQGTGTDGGDAGGGLLRVFLSGEGGGLRREYFGAYSPADPGHMAYHWRQVQWVQGIGIVGVHGNSGILFRLRLPGGDVGRDDNSSGDGGGGSPARVELLDRIASLPSKRLGMSDQFSYGYLGFAVDAATRRVHYLTGAPIFGPDGRLLAGKAATKKGESKGLEHLHYVTYDLDHADDFGGRNPYCDWGPVFFENRGGFPTYVNSVAVAGGGVFALGRLENGLTDLFRFPRRRREGAVAGVE